MKEQGNARRSMTAAEAASILGLKSTTVGDRRWRQRAGLRAFRIGGALRFREIDVLGLVEAGMEHVPSKELHDNDEDNTAWMDKPRRV